MIRLLFSFFLGAGISLFMTPGNQPPPPKAVIQVNNCNTLYAGIDNYITVLAVQDKPVSLDQMEVSSGSINGGDGNFFIRPDSPGELMVTVNNQGVKASFKYSVKPVGPVEALYGAQYPDGAQLGNGAFKAQSGVAAVINCCGFDAKCDIKSYLITRVRKDNFAEKVENTNARFGEPARELIQKARPGDMYIFSDILGRCPWDKYDRLLNSIVIRIK